MAKVRIIVVGGFLGAGKTTLLWKAAHRLVSLGKRVGLITNDQAPDLVDTALLVRQGLQVREVAGSCFCCNFPGLIEAAEQLRGEVGADVLITEPVGSCTDLSATILQPLKDRYQHEFVLAPLSVLADPSRLRDVLSGDKPTIHPSAAYIFLKQLEEADLVCVNKVDLLSEREQDGLRSMLKERLPGIPVRFVSALNGDGLDEWLRTVLSDQRSGQRIASVDYDTYAEGEAVLGWLNAAIQLTAQTDTDWGQFGRQVLARMQTAFQAREAAVGHVKMLVACGDATLAGNITQTHGELDIRGTLPVPSRSADVTLNARVEMPPEELESIVKEALSLTAGEGVRIDFRSLCSLRPGRPEPTYRYEEIIES